MKTLLDIGIIIAFTLPLMVTVGMDLETGDFRAIARRKGALLWTLLLPAFLLPLLGFALARGLALPPHLRRWKPAWAADRRRRLRNLYLAGITFLFVYAVVNRWTQMAAEWRRTALAGSAFMAASLTLARWLRLSASDSITVGLVFAVRNVALAAAIAVTLLNRIEFAAAAVVYLFTELPLLLGVAGGCRCWRARTPPLPQPAGAQA